MSSKEYECYECGRVFTTTSPYKLPLSPQKPTARAIFCDECGENIIRRQTRDSVYPNLNCKLTRDFRKDNNG